MYETGEWLKDVIEVTIIFLKKKEATKCNDHGTIILISHRAKVVARILGRRI
jgi:hypothetical protein